MLPALAAVNGKQQSPQPGRFQVPAGRGHFFAAGSPQRGHDGGKEAATMACETRRLAAFCVPGTQGGRTGCSSPFRRFPETTKKKRFLVSLEPLLWCAGRDSPAPLRTVRRTVRPGRDAGRPDGLFESLPEAPESNKKEEVLRFHKTSSLVRWKGLEPPAF